MRRLVLFHVGEKYASALKSALRYCGSSLTELCLHMCSAIDDSVLVVIGEYNTELTDLTLSHPTTAHMTQDTSKTDAITAQGIMALANCVHLVALRFGNSKLNKKDFWPLTTLLPNLIRISC